MTLGDRIREAAARVGGVDQLVMSLPDTSRRTLFDYIANRTEPRVTVLTQIAKAADVSIAWLAAGDEEENPTLPPTPVNADTVELPLYDITVGAGAGGLVISSDITEYYSVPRGWLIRNLPTWAPPNARVGIANGFGDSMEPTVHDGDLIMFIQDIDERVVDVGGIFVFDLDGRQLIKRLQVLNSGDLRIISDNPRYEPEVIPQAELEHRVSIQGYVFFTGGRPRSR